jgi:hypothetical protein
MPESHCTPSEKLIPALEGFDLHWTVVMGSTASEQFSPFIFLNSSLYLEAVFRICDILVWIRISRSVPSDYWIRLRIVLLSSVTFKRPTEQIIFFLVFLLVIFWRYIYIILQRLKVMKKSQKSKNKVFFYYFWLTMEGSGAGSGSGSVPLISRSGSGRPKPNWSRSGTLLEGDRITGSTVSWLRPLHGCFACCEHNMFLYRQHYSW